uniref:SAM domain-containing protein n=1 Tax=Parastrongyloides trichosuri TaxID=131310 RepID=A0A0N5A0L4_PARTI
MHRPQHISGYAELQDKLHKLAMARDSLILQVAVLNEHCKAEKSKLKDISSMADRLINYNNHINGGSFENDYISQGESLDSSRFGFNRQRILLEIERLQNHVAQLEISKLEAEAKLKLFQSDIEEINSVCGMSDRSSAQTSLSADSQCRTILRNISLLSKTDASRVYSELLNRLEDYELYSFYNKNLDYENCSSPESRYSSNDRPTNMTEAVYSVLNKLTNQTAQEIEKLKDQVQKLIADNQQKNVELLLMKSILMVELQGGNQNNALAIRNMLERLGIDDSKENITHSNSYPVNLAQIRSSLPSSTSYNSNLSHQDMSTPRGLPPIAPSSDRHIKMAPVVNQLKAELDELRFSDKDVQRNYSYDGNHNSRLPYLKSSYSMSLPRNSHNLLTASGCGELISSNDYDCDMTIDISKCADRQCLPPPPPKPFHRSCSVSSLAFLSNVPNRYCTPTDQNDHEKISDIPQNEKKNLGRSKSLRIYNDKIKNLSSKLLKSKYFVETVLNLGKKEPKNNNNNSNNIGRGRSFSTPNLIEQNDELELSSNSGLNNVRKDSFQRPMTSVIKNGLEIFKDENSNMKIVFSTNKTAYDNESIQTKNSVSSTNTPPFKRDRTRSTFRNLIGRLKRSSSQSANIAKPTQMYKSVSSRFCSPSFFTLPNRRPTLQQFVDWTSEQVGEYLMNIGFSEYVPKIYKNIRSGRHLLNLCDQEIEKELGIKNNLHLKRLRYNLNIIEQGNPDAADHVSISQVCIWLEDFGLPHLRDIFQENMIDGPMLNNLTAKDLIDMKIVSAIHHASISRGIQLLRETSFNIQRLESSPSSNTSFQSIPLEVKKWSQNATCQWLKSIDLVEFTPNIFGQGIHGALMVFEPTFTAESLCEILCISPQKTLLRRHVISHFNTLLGQNIITHKREVLSQPLVSYITPLIKVKIAKKQFLNVRKKSKYDVFVDAEEYVCPKISENKKNDKKRADFINNLESSNV